MKHDLLPLRCPNCDSDNLTSASCEEPRLYRVQCKDCGYLGPERKSMEEAEKAWNKIALDQYRWTMDETEPE